MTIPLPIGVVGVFDKTPERTIITYNIDKKPWAYFADFSFGIQKPSIINNIYKAKVVNNQVQGATFLDAGLDRDLFVSGVGYSLGEYLLVQITSDDHDGKTYKATTKITLKTPSLIFIPNEKNEIAYSQKLTIEKKKELKTAENEFLNRLNTVGGRLIIRTQANKECIYNLLTEFEEVVKLYQKIKYDFSHQTQIGLLKRGENKEELFIKDYLPSLDTLITNDEEIVSVAKRLGVKNIIKEKGELITITEYLESLKEIASKEIQINDKGVNIRFNYTEACTFIDVNAARFIYGKNREEGVLKTNLLSVGEIARQLCLRNIGGAVLIDFISMKNPDYNSRLIEELKKQCESDRINVKVYAEPTNLGMVELVRERKSRRTICEWVEQCPYCKEGEFFTKEYALLNLIAELKEKLLVADLRNQVSELVVNVPENLYNILSPEIKEYITRDTTLKVTFNLDSKLPFNPNSPFTYQFVV